MGQIEGGGEEKGERWTTKDDKPMMDDDKPTGEKRGMQEPQNHTNTTQKPDPGFCLVFRRPPIVKSSPQKSQQFIFPFFFFFSCSLILLSFRFSAFFFSLPAKTPKQKTQQGQSCASKSATFVEVPCTLDTALCLSEMTPRFVPPLLLPFPLFQTTCLMTFFFSLFF